MVQVNPAEAGHMNISLVSVNAESGMPVKTQVFNALEGDRSTVKTALLEGGAFILLAGQTLTKYSPELGVLATRQLPPNKWYLQNLNREIDGTWSIFGSLSSPRAFLGRTGPRGYSEGQWISARTLADDGPKLKKGYRDAVLTSSGFAFNEFSGQVEFQKIGEEYSHPLCPECKGSVRVVFGGDLVFVATNPASSFFVVDSNGSVLYRVTQGTEPDGIKSTSGAANARRVAYTTAIMKNFKAVARAVVFDLDGKRNILDMDLASSGSEQNINGMRVVSFPTPQVALSPSGLKLAILSGQSLQLYPLRKP